MKTTKSIIAIAAALSVGLATSLSAMPRSKQTGTPNSAKQESVSQSGSSARSTAGHDHLKVGPKSKRIGG